MSFEPPKGIRANLLGTLMKMDEQTFNGSLTGFNAKLWKKLLFALCFFHAVAQERRKFGSLGWNYSYEFNDSDLAISIRHLESFLSQPGSVQYTGLKYVIGECNYGGKITDKWDRRTINHVLASFFHPDIKKPKYGFSESGIYYAPEDPTLDSIIEYVKQLPMNDDPEVFEMHKNAEMTHANNDMQMFFDILTSLQYVQRTHTLETQDSALLLQVEELSKKLPDPWNEEEVLQKHPIRYDNAFEAVLYREVVAYNKLINVIKRSLSDLTKALQGFEVMTSALEQLGNELLAGTVPTLWKSHSYLTTKPLFSWFADLVERLNYFQEWIEKGEPKVFWLSGFFLPRNFIKAFLQRFARKYSVALEEVYFTTEVLNEEEDATPRNEDPNSVCFLRGLFLEGARWDREKQIVAESNPKELFYTMPLIKLVGHQFEKKSANRYSCPVYMTVDRKGDMSTLGVSSNYVTTIELPTVLPEKHWVKRGTSLFCQLST